MKRAYIIYIVVLFFVFFTSCRTIEYRDVHSYIHDTVSVTRTSYLHDTVSVTTTITEKGDTVFRDRYVSRYVHDTLWLKDIHSERDSISHVEKEKTKERQKGKGFLWFATGALSSLFAVVLVLISIFLIKRKA